MLDVGARIRSHRKELGFTQDYIFKELASPRAFCPMPLILVSNISCR